MSPPLGAASMKKFPIALLTVLLMPGCALEPRQSAGLVPHDAQLVVTSNRNVSNQWVRLHPSGCSGEALEVLGALNNETEGWPRTGSVLEVAVDPGLICLGMEASVSEPILNQRGHIAGFHYAACYPVAEFRARSGFTYHVLQESEILPGGDKAICGFNIREQSPGGESRVLRPVVQDCTDRY